MRRSYMGCGGAVSSRSDSLPFSIQHCSSSISVTVRKQELGWFRGWLGVTLDLSYVAKSVDAYCDELW